jgi:hypothetical protein
MGRSGVEGTVVMNIQTWDDDPGESNLPCRATTLGKIPKASMSSDEESAPGRGHDSYLLPAAGLDSSTQTIASVPF